MSRRHALATLSVVLMGVPLLAPPPATAVSDAALDYRRDAVQATNNIRDNRDHVELDDDACLQGFARRHTRRMAERGDIWHQDLGRILDRCDLTYVGENVAAGFRSGRSVVRDGWMESSAHRKNILQPQFRRIAVAARQGDDGRWYCTQLFGRRD